MPEVFIKTGHGITDIAIYWAEFKLRLSRHYDLSTKLSQIRKNTHTEKALVGISPTVMGLLFSEIYPGFRFDFFITEKSYVICWVKEEHELCQIRGILSSFRIASKILNMPSQKNNPVFKK